MKKVVSKPVVAKAVAKAVAKPEVDDKLDKIPVNIKMHLVELPTKEQVKEKYKNLKVEEVQETGSIYIFGGTTHTIKYTQMGDTGRYFCVDAIADRAFNTNQHVKKIIEILS